ARPGPLLGGRRSRSAPASRERAPAHDPVRCVWEGRPMAVMVPDLRKKSDAELWEILHSGEVDSPTHRQCLVMLEMRNIEKQLRAATEQARAAADQAIVSHGMVAARRGLRRGGPAHSACLRARSAHGSSGDPPGTNATSVRRQLSAKASIIAPETEAGPGEWGAPTRRRHSRSHRSNPWLIAATTLSL